MVSENRNEKEARNKAAAPVVSGRAAQVLAAYRKLEAELKSVGQKKPDMVAYKQLRRLVPIKRHGELSDVPVGLRLRGRGEAAILGIHTNILTGIDFRAGESCYAVCVSGGYADDDDHRPDGSIIYTGCGGQKARHQVVDQEENAANASLKLSQHSGLPIRVLRGRKEYGKPVYVYDGLYTCTDWTYGPSREGPKIYKFTLVPAQGNSKTKSFSVDYESSSAAAVSSHGIRKRPLEHHGMTPKKRKVIASAPTSRGRLSLIMNKKMRRL